MPSAGPASPRWTEPDARRQAARHHIIGPRWTEVRIRIVIRRGTPPDRATGGSPRAWAPSRREVHRGANQRRALYPEKGHCTDRPKTQGALKSQLRRSRRSGMQDAERQGTDVAVDQRNSADPPPARGDDHGRTLLDGHVPPMRTSLHGNDADGCVPIPLHMQAVWSADEAQKGRLLRVLLVRRCPLPADPAGACRNDVT
jgi:hypothetical protein